MPLTNIISIKHKTVWRQFTKMNVSGDQSPENVRKNRELIHKDHWETIHRFSYLSRMTYVQYPKILMDILRYSFLFIFIPTFIGNILAIFTKYLILIPQMSKSAYLFWKLVSSKCWECFVLILSLSHGNKSSTMFSSKNQHKLKVIFLSCTLGNFNHSVENVGKIMLERLTMPSNLVYSILWIRFPKINMFFHLVSRDEMFQALIEYLRRDINETLSLSLKIYFLCKSFVGIFFYLSFSNLRTGPTQNINLHINCFFRKGRSDIFRCKCSVS